jgi:hypothetical protein
MRSLLWLGMLAVSTLAHAGTSCRAESAATRLPVVELFTSEGCNSCPPADRWLARTFPAAARDAAVLAYHVDYWDGLGWRDRFASPRFTAHQQEAVRIAGARVVYTPQVLVQGRDHGLWRDGEVDKAWRAAAREPASARIALDAQAASDAMAVRIEATLARPNTSAQLLVALTESGLASDVRAGENAGVHLEHDHVVRALATGPAFGARGEASGTVSLPLPRERGRDPAIIAFVQDRRTGEVLQAVECRYQESRP